MSARVNLLLGGAGLIGRALARRLEQSGERVEIYDLRNGFDLRRVDPPTPAPGSYVWFLAWDAGGAKYIYDPAQQDTILASNRALGERVFAWLERAALPFLFTTSQLAGLDNAYGQSKLLGERRARAIGGQIARLWNVYDAEAPHVRSHVIPDLIAASSAGALRLATRGDERRQFIHADDCARGLIALRDAASEEADLTSGEWVSIREVGERLARLLGTRFEAGDGPGVEHIVEPTRPLPGWAPRIDLDDGLARVIAAMRERGWCDEIER